MWHRGAMCCAKNKDFTSLKVKNHSKRPFWGDILVSKRLVMS